MEREAPTRSCCKGLIPQKGGKVGGEHSQNVRAVFLAMLFTAVGQGALLLWPSVGAELSLAAYAQVRLVTCTPLSGLSKGHLRISMKLRAATVVEVKKAFQVGKYLDYKL